MLAFKNQMTTWAAGGRKIYLLDSGSVDRRDSSRERTDRSARRQESAVPGLETPTVCSGLL